MTSLKYDSYPQNCPPTTATEVEGVFFRFCDGEIPTKLDFLTHVDLDLNFPKEKLCEAKALSFYSNVESAEKLQKRFKRKFKDKKLIEVFIKKEFGVGEISNSHLNLWEYFGLSIFDLVKEQLEEVS